MTANMTRTVTRTMTRMPLGITLGMRRAACCFALCVSCVSVTSCDPSPACDPGQYANTGGCFPIKPADAGAHDAGGDGGGSGDDAGSVSTCPADYTGFGKSCSANSDCPCQAPTCATAPLNYCSKLECQNDPKACPSGWTCTDISAFSTDPKATHICFKM